MSSNKIKRISADIQRELSKVMVTIAKDEILKEVTITGCDVTSDLGLAKVYYTYLGESSKEEVSDALKDAEGYLRSMLAESLNLRYTPELRFIYDNSIAYGQNIERILLKLKNEDKK